MPYIGLGFFALIFLEGAVFFALLPALGLLKILILWILAGLAGGFIIRTQGLALLLNAHQSMRGGVLDAQRLFSDLAVILAGVFLIIPGFLSDLIALYLLLPRLLRGKLRRPEGTLPENLYRSPASSASDQGIIDAEYTVIDVRDEPKR